MRAKDDVGERLLEKKTRQIADEQQAQYDYERGSELALVSELAQAACAVIQNARLVVTRVVQSVG